MHEEQSKAGDVRIGGDTTKKMMPQACVGLPMHNEAGLHETPDGHERLSGPTTATSTWYQDRELPTQDALFTVAVTVDSCERNGRE